MQYLNEEEYNAKIGSWIEIVNEELERLIPKKDTPEKNIYEAMRYSIFAGGKRIRPVICLAVCEMLGGNQKDVLPFACAIEMIHTYSLIHDDLPAMDDDNYRRGRLTNHKVFGEATAILAGDALLNTAYEVMMEHALKTEGNMVQKLTAMHAIAEAAGTSGMIGGQVVDLESENKIIQKETLHYMHKCKTGALLKAPAVAAAILSGASEEQMSLIEKFGDKTGLAFQIRDDILDVEGDLASMGKQTGSDAKKLKSTYITIYGMEESKRLLNEVTTEADKCLQGFGASAEFLRTLIFKLCSRNN
ncbi:MAG: polyprenyl synthetase family protein [Bacillota bacterium]|nr:polyprenyl synthetase family protein [Bacillota bacterium]